MKRRRATKRSIRFSEMPIQLNSLLADLELHGGDAAEVRMSREGNYQWQINSLSTRFSRDELLLGREVFSSRGLPCVEGCGYSLEEAIRNGHIARACKDAARRC